MQLSGKCLCGAVAFQGEGDGHMHACHCSMCRVWGGGPGIGVVLTLSSLTGEDRLRAYRSSEWGERVFCGDCGSHLFWRTPDRSLVVAYAAGLDQADALTMERETFIDGKPRGYALAGDHPRLTGAEFMAEMGVTVET